MEDENPQRRFYAVRLEEDMPRPGKGMLIPRKEKKAIPSTGIAWLQRVDQYAILLLLPLAAFVFVLTAGSFGVQSLASVGSATLPPVTISIPATGEEKSLNYGVQVALTEPNVFAETREAFVEGAATFIEVDLTKMQLRFFEKGVLTDSFIVLAKGEAGSWWQTPAGLYAVGAKKESHFSNVGQIYQPWSISFQGNFFIHGWPEYSDGTPVPADIKAGGIRLSTEDAERLYRKVSTDTPILIHEAAPAADTFVYEAKVPEINTPHYLIADIQSSTVLASTDLEAVAPIASVAKLMTALIAAEYINLDKNVYVNAPTFIQSLIPRLGDRRSVSMYSLLQLLLVESSNEAAEVIASELGREEFITKMNQKARSLGMTRTNFADPSGLSAENTSSLSDLLRLAQYIHKNRSFVLELTANQHIATAYVGGEFGELVNFNRIEELQNFIGGKVGETIAAGQTSVTLHKLTVKGEERVVAIIILGSDDRNRDVLELLRYAEERFGS